MNLPMFDAFSYQNYNFTEMKRKNIVFVNAGQANVINKQRERERDRKYKLERNVQYRPIKYHRKQPITYILYSTRCRFAYTMYSNHNVIIMCIKLSGYTYYLLMK